MDSVGLLKLITSFATPLGFSLLLGLLGLLIKQRGLVLLAFAWLWLWSTPWAAEALARGLERDYPLLAAQQLPEADAIVVLGGAMYSAVPGWHPEHNLTASGDRILFGRKLLALGKAPVLIYSGGPTTAAGYSEAKSASELIPELGLPGASIVTETESRTTRENAQFSMPLLAKFKARRVLLVTSRWHMRRSMQNYQSVADREGLAISFVPAACDPIQLAAPPAGQMRYLPSTEALDVSRALFKEWLGIAYARLGGN